MPGLFDRLDKEIKDNQKKDGISPLDIAKLPPAMRKIMRVMLRELQASYPRMCEVVESMPEQDRLTRAELDETQLEKFHGTKSLPFEAGDNKKIAVKIIDDRGIESLKVMNLD